MSARFGGRDLGSEQGFARMVCGCGCPWCWRHAQMAQPDDVDLGPDENRRRAHERRVESND